MKQQNLKDCYHKIAVFFRIAVLFAFTLMSTYSSLIMYPFIVYSFPYAKK